MSFSKKNGVERLSISKIIGIDIVNIAKILKIIVPAPVAERISDNAIVYDGVDANSYIIEDHTFAKILETSTNDAATISLWINVSGVTSTNTLYILGSDWVEGPTNEQNVITLKRSSSTDPSVITVRAQNTQILKTSSGTAYFEEVQTTTSVTDDWIHLCLAATQSAGGTGYDVTIYVNGSTQTDTGVTSTAGAASNTIVKYANALGARYDAGMATIGSRFQMKLSDYIVWSDELTSSEITEIYNAGVGEFDPSTNSGNYASSADLEIHYEVGNENEDLTEAPVTNNTGTAGNLINTNVEFETL